MSVKLSDLSKKLNLTLDALKAKLKAKGVALKPAARTVDDDIAHELEAEMNSAATPANVEDEMEAGEVQQPQTTAKVYEEIVDKELDKEIIKSQRKMMAGKDTGGKPKKTVPSQPLHTIASEVEIAEAITVKEFSEKTGLNPVKIIGELMKNGILANINQTIDYETASIIADDFGIKLKRKRTEATIEDISMGNLKTLIDEKDEKELVTRPPVVTIMGHVDHGKTKLLDAIRETDIVSTEAGGITQHIGAYQVEKNGKKITFIDTPGHEAFASMRARGAKITDIVILVVAADEGVKPQTTEALNHAKEAGVPIMVAINKIDKEDINIDRVKVQLSELGLQPEDWGGKTVMVPVSAMTGEGIPLLLEMILLTAEVENLKANPNRPAVATVVEAHLDKSLGPVATVLVNTGTLRIQDSVILGDICGRIKTMRNHLGKNIETAPPSMPVQIAGIEAVPVAGDILQVVKNMDAARRKAEQIKSLRNESGEISAVVGIEQIMSAIQAGKLKTLKVVLKADTLGSLEALRQSLAQVKKDEVSIKVIHAGVGDISESDVMMAAASSGIVVGFHTVANLHVNNVAERKGVQIFIYQIIYKLIDDLKKILSGLLEPEVTQVTLGRAEVRMIYMTERRRMIVGCKVISGKVENKTRVRVFRKDELIGEGFLESLKHNNDQVHEIGEGNDCGIKFEGPVELAVGDALECWKEERRTRIVT